MIKVENGKVTVDGTGKDIEFDFSCIVSSVYQCMRESGYPRTMAQREIDKYVKVGFMMGEDKFSENNDDSNNETDEIEDALIHLLDLLKGNKNDGNKKED